MIKKCFVFVLMPLDHSFDDIYKLGIKETCEHLNSYCERVDEQIFEERILDRIYNQINKADIIVADMTGQNPNVFYEVGYAHALNKKVVLLTQNVNDIPFDLKHHHHIAYNKSITTLKAELSKRITWFQNNPDKSTLPQDSDLEFYIEGIRLEAGAKIFMKSKIRKEFYNSSKAVLPIKIDIHNKGVLVFDSRFKIGVVVESFEDCTSETPCQSIRLNEKKYLHNCSISKVIFPLDWESVELLLISQTLNVFETGNKEFNVTIQIFMEFGVKDIPIVIFHEKNNDWF